MPRDEAILEERELSLLAALTVELRRRGAAAGAAASLRGGGRWDLLGLRPYSSGDDLSLVDWAAYLRSERLYTREFHREEEGRAVILLDTSASMGEPPGSKWLQARKAAAAFAFLALEAGLRVELGALGEEARMRAVGKGRLTPLAVWLARQQPRSAGPLALGSLPRAGAAELVVISDLLVAEELRRPMAAACEGGYRLTLVGTLAHEELVPAARGRVRIEDPEGRQAPFHLDVGEAEAAAYEREVARRQEGWRRFALRHGGALLWVDAARGAVPTIASAVLRGALLS